MLRAHHYCYLNVDVDVDVEERVRAKNALDGTHNTIDDT